MMLGVVPIVEKEPVVDLAVAAHAPRDRFVRISAVMPVITIEVTEAVAEIEKRQEIKNDVAPVKEKHHEERRCERCQLNIPPHQSARSALAQFFPDCAHVVAKETKEDVAPGVLRLAVVAVFVNRNPIDGIAIFIRPRSEERRVGKE